MCVCVCVCEYGKVPFFCTQHLWTSVALVQILPSVSFKLLSKLHIQHIVCPLWCHLFSVGLVYIFLLISSLTSLTLSLGSLLMVFSGLRTRNTLRDLMVLMSRPLLFLHRKTDSVSITPLQQSKRHIFRHSLICRTIFLTLSIHRYIVCLI